jgi:hypothetical protein
MKNEVTIEQVADEINNYFFDANEECYGISKETVAGQIAYYDKYFSDGAEFDEKCKLVSTIIKNYLNI